MTVWNRMKSLINPDYVEWSLIAVGIILRLRQYLANRSLWADEASLAVNIANRTFGGLTQPLDYHQAAPIGFLFIEKFFIVLLGNKDYILRLFPLFAGILAIYLLHRITKEYFGGAGMATVLMFSINSWLIFFSSELKQYSSDVMVALLLIYLSSRCFKEDARVRDFQLLGVGGIMTIWMSHISIFILAGIGLTLVLEKIIHKKYMSFSWIIGLGAVWLISFGAEYIFTLQYIAADKYFQTYWQKAFMPLPPWRDIQWLVKTYYSFILIIVGRTDSILILMIPALAFIGSVSLFIRNRSIAIVIIFPFIAALAASALEKYPLSYRFMLFLIPSILLLMTEGIRSIYLFFAKWQRGPALILSGIPIVVMLWFLIPIAWNVFNSPEKISEIKPIMEYVGKSKTQNDVIYIYYGSAPAFIYYAPFYHLDPTNAIFGSDSLKKKVALNSFFDDVEKLKGNDRVWFIFSDIVDCGGCYGDKRIFFTDYLDKFGTMLDSVRGTAAGAYLYDLSP
jgi:Dolichyl-phosphate-mannose-protein mannosyltransferase